MYRRDFYIDFFNLIVIIFLDLKQGKDFPMKLTQFRVYTLKPMSMRTSVVEWLAKTLETCVKCLGILVMGIIPSGIMVGIWDIVFRAHLIQVGAATREILMTAIVPTLGIMYSLLVAKLIDKVFDEYKDMRMAVKQKNKEVFMLLADEDLSPLLHGVAMLLAFGLLICLMVISYETFAEGAFVVGAVSYIFSILCIVVFEVDNPCYGFWVIRSIPSEWLTEDPKGWRNNFYDTSRKNVRQLSAAE
jgi:hypothetical protein